MHQSVMLLKLEIKRAMKNLPQLMLGAAIISLVVVIIVISSAYSRNSKTVTKRIDIGLVTNNNSIISSVGMDVLGNMDTAKNLFSIDILEEEEARRGFDEEKYSCIIIFPDNYISSVDRGENLPAEVLLRNSGMSFSTNMIAEICTAAGDLLAAAESTSYSAGDLCREFQIKEYRSTIIDEVDVVNARMILSREDNFSKVTIYGEDDISLSQGYACAAAVMLMLLWGISCGSVLKSDSPVLTKKLESNLIPMWRQQMFKLISIFCLLGSMFMILATLLIGAYPAASEVYKAIDVENIWQLVFLVPAFIPAIILASAMVMFAFSVASNQIGGIIFLFTSSIVMGYISGCLMPSVYLTRTIRRLGKYMPTTYMLKQAENAINGKVDLMVTLIILVFALAFFGLSVLITKIKYRRA